MTISELFEEHKEKTLTPYKAYQEMIDKGKELELEIEELNKDVNTASNVIRGQVIDIDSLKTYAEHKSKCKWGYDSPCTCGYWKIMNWKSPLHT